MSVKEYSWKSFDGLNLYAVEWETSEIPQAVVAFVHGHGDHCRRYDDWFSTMANAGIAVVALDYRGHGRSEGKRGVINHMEDLYEDALLLINKSEALHPGIPLVLLGHSMGAVIVLSLLIRRLQKPASAIVTSPWLELSRPHSRLLSIGIALAGTFLPRLTFRTGLHASDFRASDDYNRKSEKDDYVHNRISARLLSEVNREIDWIKLHYNQISTPLLLLQGSDDRIMNIAETKRFSKMLPDLIENIEFDNAGHQLQNSESSGEIIKKIINWIKNKL